MPATKGVLEPQRLGCETDVGEGADSRDQHSALGPAFLPFSERAFLRLPGPWLAWAVLWSALGPFGIALAQRLKAIPFSEHPAALTTWGLLVLAGILIARSLSQDVADLRSTLERLTGKIGDAALEPFAGLGNVTGPALIAAALAAAYLLQSIRRELFGVTIVTVGLTYVTNLGLSQGLWAMVVVLRGLNTLGKARLTLLPFDVDRSLGLHPLGQLAFKVFLTALAIAAPAILVTSTTPIRLASNVLVLFAIVAVFFLSMYRLHQHLVSEKRKLRVWSGQMTAVAVAPLKRELTPECFQAHALGVLAADTIARQVGAVQEWPVDERVFRIVAAITTSVAAAVCARLLLTRIGL